METAPPAVPDSPARDQPTEPVTAARTQETEAGDAGETTEPEIATRDQPTEPAATARTQDTEAGDVEETPDSWEQHATAAPEVPEPATGSPTDAEKCIDAAYDAIAYWRKKTEPATKEPEPVQPEEAAVNLRPRQKSPPKPRRNLFSSPEPPATPQPEEAGPAEEPKPVEETTPADAPYRLPTPSQEVVTEFLDKLTKKQRKKREKAKARLAAAKAEAEKAESTPATPANATLEDLPSPPMTPALLMPSPEDPEDLYKRRKIGTPSPDSAAPSYLPAHARASPSWSGMWTLEDMEKHRGTPTGTWNLGNY